MSLVSLVVYSVLVAALLGFAPNVRAQQPQRVNLAKYQPAQSSSATSGDPAVYTTDGIVGNGNRWKSEGSGPHWLTVTLPLAMSLGSAQVYLGRDDLEPVASFALQSWTGTDWADIPGAVVINNAENVLNLVFAAPVTTSRVRFYTTENEVRLREIALYPPAGPSGFAIGTDVTLNLAKQRPASASSVDGDNVAKNAVDGYADDGARWKSAEVNGPHHLEVDLQVSSRVGSAHLYFGTTAAAPSQFSLEWWTGSAWNGIPGGAVSGNTSYQVALEFASPVTTSRVRLVLPGNGAQRVRELAVFAAHGGPSYSLGTDVVMGPRPPTGFNTFGDGFWKIVNRANPHSLIAGPGGAGQTLPDSTEEEKWFQVLYNLESDTFRLRNRDSYLCLGARDAGLESGTAVVELPDYHGLPHELWRFYDVGGGDYRIVNVWNGLALETDGGTPASVTLRPPAATTRQFWRFDYITHYPKKGTGGYEEEWARFGTSWHYNWSRDTGVRLPSGVLFSPMQHNRSWPPWDTLPQYYPAWHTASRPVEVLGFNEPDQAGQADMPVGEAIALWPRLERSDVPLASPAPAAAYNGWLGDFYSQANALGFRVDFTAVHWYNNPDAGALIGHLQGVYNTWGRPVWLTEFSTVDWGGGATWTEEDNYRFIAEFLWRAEDLDWLKRYALFVFTGNPPAHPWDRVGPRSNMLRSDGSLTAFGEYYAAWDGDRVRRERVPYILHGKGSSHRLRASSVSNVPSTGDIRRSDVSTHVALVPAASANRWAIVSLRDGRRLRFDGAVLEWGPPGSVGPEVEWSFNGPDGSGYTFIDHPLTSKSLRLGRTNDENGAPTSLDYTMENFGTVNDSTRWRFVKPHQPVPLPPLSAPPALSAVAGQGRVTLSWPPNTEPTVLGYTVYRGLSPGGPYTRLAALVPSSIYIDITGQPGVTYYYVVAAADWIESETAYSPEASAAPVAASELIATGAVWKYNDAGLNLGVSWRGVGYPDAAWPSGPAQLGYGDGDEATTNRFGPNPAAKYITTYYRHTFNVADPAVFGSLQCRILRDDGAVVYLNGSEVFRSNMPGGAVGYLTLATSAIGGSDEDAWHYFSASPALLRAGNNALAVEVHQAAPDSSDLSFDLGLEASAPEENFPPQVILAGPPPNSRGTTPGSVALVPQAWDPNGAVARVEFFANGLKIGQSITAPFAMTWVDPSVGHYVLTAMAVDDAGAWLMSEPVPFTVDARLVSAGEVWKYYDGGLNLGVAWRMPAYNDALWPGGPAPLGYGDGDENTVTSFGPDPANKFIATYFRRPFTLDQPTFFSNLVLRLQVDDGAVVYLNGIEVARRNMPAGAVGAFTLAETALGEPEESAWHSFDLGLGAVVPGANLLAVEVHQAAPDSSDLGFDLELVAAMEPPGPPVLSIARTSGDIILTWPNLGWFELYTATALAPGGEWIHVTQPATLSSGLWTVRVPWDPAQNQFFRLQGP